MAILGDYTDGDAIKNLNNSGGAKDDMKILNSYLNNLRFAPNLRQMGNHDFYKDNPSLISRFIQSYSDDVVWGDKVGGYYYRDFDEYQLRVISLNLNEINEVSSNNTSNGLVAISEKQYEWFVKTLDMSNKEDAAEW